MSLRVVRSCAAGVRGGCVPHRGDRGRHAVNRQLRARDLLRRQRNDEGRIAGKPVSVTVVVNRCGRADGDTHASVADDTVTSADPVRTDRENGDLEYGESCCSVAKRSLRAVGPIPARSRDRGRFGASRRSGATRMRRRRTDLIGSQRSPSGESAPWRRGTAVTPFSGKAIGMRRGSPPDSVRPTRRPPKSANGCVSPSAVGR